MPMKLALHAAIGMVLLLTGVAFAQTKPPIFTPPVNLGPPINTTFNERDPFITADGQKLFFVSDWPEGNLDIWMSTWNGTTWGTPINCGPNVNSGLIEWSPSVSPDGKRLYFSAFGRPGSQGGWDIWYSDWDSVSQQWGSAQNLGPVINSFVTDWRSEISRYGQALYYASNGFGHPRGQALYYSHWNGNSWSSPESLIYIINNSGTEENPSLTADEKTMYFVRWDPFRSIYMAERATDTSRQWNQPVWLDSVVNHPSGTGDPCITPDGLTLYFASDRPGGMGSGTADIWVSRRVNLGDVDLDGQLTLTDIVYELNKTFFGEPFSAPTEAGDVNCDDVHTAADVVLLLNRVYLQRPFPCNR